MIFDHSEFGRIDLINKNTIIIHDYDRIKDPKKFHKWVQEKLMPIRKLIREA